MAFHGCLCTECDRLYGYVGMLPSGKKIVCGKCDDGWRSIRHIELVLEAQKLVRENGDDMTSDNVMAAVDEILERRRQADKERSERAELNRLERKYRRRGRKS